MEGQVQVQQTAKVPLPPGLAGWMAFVAIWTIVGGAINCITFIGIIWGVLMIAAGAALWSGKAILEGMNGVDPSWLPFLDKLKLFMMLTGITYILGLVLTVLLVIFFLGVGLAGLNL